MNDPAPASVLHLHALDRSGEDEGQFQHRIANPIALLAAEPDLALTHRSWLSPDAPRLAVSADIVVVHGLAGEEIEGLIRERRRAGRITLFEIGDELSSPRPWSRRSPDAPGPLTVGRVLLHASLSDGVQFSSPWLRDRYAAVNPDSAVLDNLVAFPDSVPGKPEGFTVGWAGTRSHKADLASVAPAITAFCRRHPDVRFALMGDRELWPPFETLGAQFAARPFGAYADYGAFLAGLHVGLVPLGDTVFNLGRSDVKPVEMAAAGAVVLAQDAPAYRHLGGVVELFTDGADLDARLERLYRDRATLADTACAMRRAVGARRGAAAVRAQQVDWYRRWPATRGGPLPPPPDPDPAPRLDNALQRARGGDGLAALETAAGLLAEDADHAQARWLAARLLARLGRTDEALAVGAALAACPVFRHVWWPFAATLTGDRDLRQRTGIPFLRVAPRGEGDAETARYHRDMLAAHPYHPFALAVEQRRLERRGDVAAAAELRLRRRLLDRSPPPGLGGGSGP